MTLCIDLVKRIWQDGSTVKNASALLRAIATLNGDALILHPGDRPYIVAADRQIELSTRPLSEHALDALLVELLPPASRNTLKASGAVQWEIPAGPETPEGRFVVVAARVAEDPWVEVRRYASVKLPLPFVQMAKRQSQDDGLLVPSAAELWPGVSEKFSPLDGRA